MGNELCLLLFVSLMGESNQGPELKVRFLQLLGGVLGRLLLALKLPIC